MQLAMVIGARLIFLRQQLGLPNVTHGGKSKTILIYKLDSRAFKIVCTLKGAQDIVLKLRLGAPYGEWVMITLYSRALSVRAQMARGDLCRPCVSSLGDNSS